MTLETVRIRYPVAGLKLGVDGWVPRSKAIFDDGCCPDSLCIDFCDTACAFVDLLPTGPMWDRQKEAAKACIPECSDACVDECTTMASFAIYGARILHDSVDQILWPTVREASPYTAVTTLDDWLDRYGWQDCFRTYCRSPYAATVSPYEHDTECGSEYCAPTFSDEFECALKHAILLSLVRASRGVINNLDGLNWVIEPLGAFLEPQRPWPQDVRSFLRGSCEPEDGPPPCFCDEVALEICNSTDTLPGCPLEPCGEDAPTVAAEQTYECDGEDPVQLYPGVIAAQCIVSSLLPHKCPNIIFRC